MNERWKLYAEPFWYFGPPPSAVDRLAALSDPEMQKAINRYDTFYGEDGPRHVHFDLVVEVDIPQVPE